MDGIIFPDTDTLLNPFIASVGEGEIPVEIAIVVALCVMEV
jgi:hypothetical protein